MVRNQVLFITGNKKAPFPNSKAPDFSAAKRTCLSRFDLLSQRSRPPRSLAHDILSCFRRYRGALPRFKSSSELENKKAPFPH